METFWVRSIVLRVFSPTCDRSDERYDSAFEARNSSSNEDTATVSAVVSSVIFPVSSCVRKKYAKATDAPAITVIAIRISDIKIFCDSQSKRSASFFYPITVTRNLRSHSVPSSRFTTAVIFTVAVPPVPE